VDRLESGSGTMNLQKKWRLLMLIKKIKIGLLQDAWVNAIKMIHKPKQRCEGVGVWKAKYVRCAQVDVTVRLNPSPGRLGSTGGSRRLL